MKEIWDLFTTDSPLAWVFGTILIIYFGIKIPREIIGWISSLFDKRKKEIIDTEARCQTHEKEISLLKQAVLNIEKLISDLKTQIERLLI